jgi:hypothetical protein
MKVAELYEKKFLRITCYVYHNFFGINKLKEIFGVK